MVQNIDKGGQIPIGREAATAAGLTQITRIAKTTATSFVQDDGGRKAPV